MPAPECPYNRSFVISYPRITRRHMTALRRRGGVSVGWLKSHFDFATVHLVTTRSKPSVVLQGLYLGSVRRFRCLPSSKKKTHGLTGVFCLSAAPVEVSSVEPPYSDPGRGRAEVEPPDGFPPLGPSRTWPSPGVDRSDALHRQPTRTELGLQIAAGPKWAAHGRRAGRRTDPTCARTSINITTSLHHLFPKQPSPRTTCGSNQNAGPINPAPAARVGRTPRGTS